MAHISEDRGAPKVSSFGVRSVGSKITRTFHKLEAYERPLGAFLYHCATIANKGIVKNPVRAKHIAFLKNLKHPLP